MRGDVFNVNVLAEDDATIQVTWSAWNPAWGEPPPPDERTALLTVRAKDNDLTAAQLRRLAAAALRAAEVIEAGQ